MRANVRQFAPVCADSCRKKSAKIMVNIQVAESRVNRLQNVWARAQAPSEEAHFLAKSAPPNTIRSQ